MTEDGTTLQRVLEELAGKDAVDEAVAAAKKRNLHLALHAVKSKIVTQDELADRLAAKAHTLVVDVGSGQIDPKVVARVPKAIAQRCLAVPIGRDGDAYQVAFADPLDSQAIDDMRHALAAPVRVLAAPVGDIAGALEAFESGSETRDLPEEPTVQIQKAMLRDEGGNEIPATATAQLYRPGTEATLEQKHEALVLALVEAGVITRESYHAALQRLLGND